MEAHACKIPHIHIDIITYRCIRVDILKIYIGMKIHTHVYENRKSTKHETHVYTLKEINKY